MTERLLFVSEVKEDECSICRFYKEGKTQALGGRMPQMYFSFSFWRESGLLHLV